MVREQITIDYDLYLSLTEMLKDYNQMKVEFQKCHERYLKVLKKYTLLLSKVYGGDSNA